MGMLYRTSQITVLNTRNAKHFEFIIELLGHYLVVPLILGLFAPKQGQIGLIVSNFSSHSGTIGPIYLKLD